MAIGFFLPWLDGAGEFAARDFSGFDLARLVRNFEIVQSSSTEAGKLRITALALYLVPALAVNGALTTLLPPLRPLAPWALAVAAAYGAAILAASLLLSAVSWTDLGRVMGTPLAGFWTSLAGVALLAVAAVAGLRAPPRGP